MANIIQHQPVDVLKTRSRAPSLVLVRHGESKWNQQNRFTGWLDVHLTEFGEHQARHAGRILAAEGWQFDHAFTSLLTRSIKSQWLILEELEQAWLPIEHNWRWNGRHYGDLTGHSQAEAIQLYGTPSILRWRRSYDAAPPPLPIGDSRDVLTDHRYSHIPPSSMPRTESLQDVVARVEQFWLHSVRPLVASSKRVLLCGHGSGIRAFVGILDELSGYDTAQLDVPNGTPLAYWLDDELRPIYRCYLDDENNSNESRKKAAVMWAGS